MIRKSNKGISGKVHNSINTHSQIIKGTGLKETNFNNQVEDSTGKSNNKEFNK